MSVRLSVLRGTDEVRVKLSGNTRYSVKVSDSIAYCAYSNFRLAFVVFETPPRTE